MFISSKEKAQGRVFLINNIVCFALCIVVATRHQWKPGELSFFDSIVLELFASLQEGASGVKTQSSQLIDHYFFLVDTRKENEKLRHEIAILNEQLFEKQSLVDENQRLKELLNFGDELKFNRVMAQVIGWDIANEFRVLRVNKGSKHGIRPRMTVMTAAGLVGYTYQVAPNYTDILTVLNQNNRVDVLVQRTRAFGVIEGAGSHYGVMKYVERNQVIEEGDLLITAGYGDLYPKGIRVGTVQRIRKDDFALTQDVRIKPLVDFQSLEEVLILTSEKEEEKDD